MNRKFFLILFASLLLRIFLLLSAHHGDLNNNISWGEQLVLRGTNFFYEGKNWPYSAPNQPPLTVLMFGALMWLFQTIDTGARILNDKLSLFPSTFIWFWEQHGKDILVKLPSVFADLAIGYIIYKYFNQLNKRKTAITMCTLWLFNPVVWFNSSVWGQTDPIVNLLGLLGVVALLRKKLERVAVWVTLSILFKGSLFIFAPVLLFVALTQKYKPRVWGNALLVSVITLYIVCWPLHPYFDIPFWLGNLYIRQILPGEIGFLTANAFNFWWLVDPGKTLDTTVYLGLPAKIWGYLIALTGISFILYRLREKLDDKRVFWALSVSALITFLFLTRIHERYLYPFFPAGTILAGLSPAFLAPYLILSAAHLFNLFNLFPMPVPIDIQFLYNSLWFIPTFCTITLIVLFWILKDTKKYT